MSTRSTQDPWVLDKLARAVRGKPLWLRALHFRKQSAEEDERLTLCQQPAAHVRPRSHLGCVSQPKPSTCCGALEPPLSPAAWFHPALGSSSCSFVSAKAASWVKITAYIEPKQHGLHLASELELWSESLRLLRSPRKRKSEGAGPALVRAGSAKASEYK